MKIAHFDGPDGAPGVGVVEAPQLWPLRGFDSLLALIAAGDGDPAAAAAGAERGAPLDLDEVQLRAPLDPAVRDYFCVGLNYLAHVEEGREFRGAAVPDEIPKYPTFFTKATLTANGPYAPVPLHEHTTRRLDFEAELAVVIGRRGRDIDPAVALGYVAGYTCANDISARELQRRHGGQWVKGKSLDGTCPTGPWLVTRDEIPDPQTLDLCCRLNGERMQHASTARMIFSVAQLIADLSAGMTLIPGDVILTGTPEGVGFARKPPVYLADADVLETEISGIGTMRNVIRAG